jgi:glucosamine--fructose-6-phosphate aminotransferase (isomerizing)
MDGELSLTGLNDPTTTHPKWVTLHNEYAVVDKAGYSHFMLKEVMEQWRTIPRAATVEADQLESAAELLRQASNIIVTGAGGAAYVAEQIAWQLRQVMSQPCIAVKAYELESWRRMLQQHDVLVAISQSGETADTLSAMTLAREQKMRVISVVNMPGSTIADQSDICFPSRSGPEICVLSTKSATAQLSWGHALTGYLSGRNIHANDTDMVAHQLCRVLDRPLLSEIRKIAIALGDVEHMFVLGRDRYFAAAQIGALNIKEASYIHAEAFAGGELKHGVIALIEEGTPVIVFADADDGYMINVASEVKARGATVIGIAEEDNELFDYYMPLGFHNTSFASVTSIIPCQLLAYCLAVLRGNNPDRPRNLAKSVTVQ